MRSGLEAAAVETADNNAATRLQASAEAARRIEDAAAIRDALDLLERAVYQVSARSLPMFMERTGRLYALALARIKRAERRGAGR